MATEFVAGCLGGCAGVAVGHPLDTIKVRIQTQDSLNPKYRGTWDCFRQTLQNESVRGLYKGMSSPLVGVSLVNAVIFGVHGNIIKHLKDKTSLTSQAIAGGGAGFAQAFITCPMELAKTRMQIQSSTSTTAYRNPIQCLKGIISQNGLRAAFKGQTLTIMREVPGFTAYFTAYEYLLGKFTPKDEESSGPAILLAGGLAGICSWFFTYPIDVVKTRIQVDGVDGETKYKGMLHCLKSSVANEGFSVLTRGLTSTLIRAFPTNAATFMVVSMVMDFCEETEYSYMDSATWRDVIHRGEVLISSAAAPIMNRVNPVIKREREHVIHLQRIIQDTIVHGYRRDPIRG